MRSMILSRTLRYKQITESWLESHISSQMTRKKGTLHQVNFFLLFLLIRVKIKKRLAILGSYQRAEQVGEHAVDYDTNCCWCSWNSSQRSKKEAGELEFRGRIGLKRFWNHLKHLEESWRTEETCCHSDICGKPPVKSDAKNLHAVKIILVNGHTTITLSNKLTNHLSDKKNAHQSI